MVRKRKDPLADKFDDAAYQCDKAMNNLVQCARMMRGVRSSNSKEEANQLLDMARICSDAAIKQALKVDEITHKPLGKSMKVSKALYSMTRAAHVTAQAAIDCQDAIEEYIGGAYA